MRCNTHRSTSLRITITVMFWNIFRDTTIAKIGNELLTTSKEELAQSPLNGRSIFLAWPQPRRWRAQAPPEQQTQCCLEQAPVEQQVRCFLDQRSSFLEDWIRSRTQMSTKRYRLVPALQTKTCTAST